MKLLRHLLFYIFALGWTLCLAPTLLFIVLPRRFSVRVSVLWAKGLLKGASVFLRLSSRAEEQRYLPSKGSYLIACKHQSVWETLFLTTLLKDPLFFLKRQLLWIPLVGWFLWRLGMIPVSKGGRTTQRRMTEALKKGLSEQRAIVLFPEGTRTKPGQSVPYRSGVYTIASRYGLTVIPAGLNSGDHWKKHTFFKKSGTLIIRFCPPLSTSTGADAFMNSLKEAIEKTSEALRNTTERKA